VAQLRLDAVTALIEVAIALAYGVSSALLTARSL